MSVFLWTWHIFSNLSQVNFRELCEKPAQMGTGLLMGLLLPLFWQHSVKNKVKDTFLC